MNAVGLFLAPALAGLGLWLMQPSYRTSRRVSLVVAFGLALAALDLVFATADGAVVVHAFGSWRPPFGIAFAVDRLSALFAAVQATLLLVTLLALRAEAHGDESVRRAHPLLFLLTAGLMGGFLTADLFDLFVMFELVLVASYLLLQVPGTRRSLAGTLPTLAVNVVAAALFLGGLGVLYAITGSVDFADLTRRLPDAPPDLRRVALVMLVVAFATKAAVVPLCFWMPATYPTLSAPLAALLAGIMTKLGVYALLRTLPLIALDPLLPPVLVWVGGLSALLGVLAALSQYEMRRLLSFHSVSQVGYMLAALGLASDAGVASAAFFALHHSFVKSALYLVADELERRNGTRDLRGMDSARAGGGALTLCFAVAAFSLAGLPPFSGYFGKVSVFVAAFRAEAHASLVLLVIASLFTLASMLKIWRFGFQPRPGAADAAPRQATPQGALVAALVVVIALGLAAGPVFDYVAAAGAASLDPSAYVEAVRALDAHPRELR